jgi:O-succinylbenzoic acid--CoA ligase
MEPIWFGRPGKSMKSIALTLNNQLLEGSALKEFSTKKIHDTGTPSWEKDVFRFILNWLSDSDSIFQYSSGTTGRSKKLHLLKRSMVRSAENTCSYLHLIKGQTAVSCLSMDYIAGKMMVVRCMVGGLNLQIVEPSGKPDLSGLKEVDFCAMVPIQVLNTFKGQNNLTVVKKLLIGGAEITPELESIVYRLPAEVYASYGMAETCSHVALRRLNGPDAQSAYHALPEVSLTMDDRGCLVIASSYLPDQIVTNDLVEFTGHHAFKWLGRYDNLINTAGIKIVPEEMEARIAEKTGLESVLIGVPDKKLGQRPILVLEKKPDLSESIIKPLIEKLFPGNNQIREIAWITEFPRNESYKLDRRKLAEMVSRMS